ncbi:type II toxin-antitoxin system RelE/ParE family toxin [Candidatus Woesearchaeota archaeon]|nr:type II toxin-antitoxin system RelE/ParE family toxin [Candidatus Woesearchaeota archaeon]
MYTIFTTDEFDKRFSKLDKIIQQQIEKEITQLEINPYVGKPLGYRFFREKKAKKYRIYYLIYEDYVVVFVITLSDKKGQQLAIDHIKDLIPFYKEEIKKRVKGLPLSSRV